MCFTVEPAAGFGARQAAVSFAPGQHGYTKRFARPRLQELRLLAIDEISIGHGQRYFTVVLDLEASVRR